MRVLNDHVLNGVEEIGSPREPIEAGIGITADRALFGAFDDKALRIDPHIGIARMQRMEGENAGIHAALAKAAHDFFEIDMDVIGRAGDDQLVVRVDRTHGKERGAGGARRRLAHTDDGCVGGDLMHDIGQEIGVDIGLPEHEDEARVPRRRERLDLAFDQKRAVDFG